MCEQLKYAKKFVLPSLDKAREFLSQFLTTEIGEQFRTPLYPVANGDKSEEVAPYAVKLSPLSDLSGMKALAMKRLDALLLDGELKDWKWNLASLEDPVPCA